MSTPDIAIPAELIPPVATSSGPEQQPLGSNAIKVDEQPVFPVISPLGVRENLRGEIVLNLMWLAAGQIGFACLVLAFGKMTMPEVKDLMLLIFTPTVVLLGVAAGFYYAGRQD